MFEPKNNSGGFALCAACLRAVLRAGIPALLLLLSFTALCEGQASPRPVVFVHGFMGDSAGWGAPNDTANLRGALIGRLAASAGITNTTNYDIYFDGVTVLYSVTGKPADDLLAVENIPSSARFFTVRFFSGNPLDPFEPLHTADISILNKATELSHILEAISEITHVQSSVLVAHSQGGLVARAYLEGMGSENPCRNVSYLPPCTPGQTAYNGDVAHLVTLDTPYGGGDFTAFLDLLVVLQSIPLGRIPINVFELAPGSDVLLGMNYVGLGPAASAAQPLPADVTIDSVTSFLQELGYRCPDNGNLTCFSDDVVESRSQAVRLNLPANHLTANLTDVGNPISAGDPQITSITGLFIGLGACKLALPGSPFPPLSIINPFQGVLLHLISCEGHVTSTQNAIFNSISAHEAGATTTVTVKATLDGAPFPATQALTYKLINQGPLGTKFFPGSGLPHTFTDVPLGSYSLANITGGPSPGFTLSISGTESGATVATSELGLDAATGKRVTDLTIVIRFVSAPSAPPVVATSPVGPLQCDSAVLNGTVNPNGSSVNTYFEWGTSSLLTSFSATQPQPLAGNAATPISFTLPGLTCNTGYFYRAVADNGHGAVRGSIVGFTTVSALPKPALLTPAAGATGVSASPTFTWSAVPGASSYRLIVATSPADLPRDPTSAACGAGCVFNVTPGSASYTPVAGTLAPGLVYYWEVHARSASQFGLWSDISSFSVGTTAPADFSFRVTPASQPVGAPGTAAFTVSTAATTPSSPSVLLSAANLPAGVTGFFTPSTVVAGGTSVFNVTVSASAAPGSYPVTIVASGPAATRSTIVTLAVSATTGTPAVTFSPSALSFSDQVRFTNSPSQLVSYANTGTAPLQVLSIVGDNNFAVVNPCINTLPPGTQCTFSVVFDPSTSGPLDGKAQLFFAGSATPAVLSLHGTGLAPPPTTATIQVSGTLNGAPLPNTEIFSYPFSYALAGPTPETGGGAETFTVTPGTYTASFAGSPASFTLASVSPSATQTVGAGGALSFVLNFTAPNDFVGPDFSFPVGGTSPKTILAGGQAGYSVSLPNPPPGNASSPITLELFGLPPTATFSFSPQPLNSGLTGALTVNTSAATAPGPYTLSLTGTNSSGLVHPGTGTSALVVTTAPSTPLELASRSTGGLQGNSASNISINNNVSADGRVVAFVSASISLDSGNGLPQVFVRDRKLGTTKVASAFVGVAIDGAFAPAVSGDGRFVTFVSDSFNLPSPPPAGQNAVYIKDLSSGTILRVDLTLLGNPNGSSIQPAISADGRFVAYVSSATNLVAGGTSGRPQVYLRDMAHSTTVPVSVGTDGSEGDHVALSPAVSADGRYIAFFSNSTNLTAGGSGGFTQVFVRDMQSGATSLVSAAPDGSPANSNILTTSTAPSISADGRFIAFTSNATNLVPGAIGVTGNSRIFVRDRIAGTTVAADIDEAGQALPGGGSEPSLSPDGRFLAYRIYGQTMVRDLSGSDSRVVSVAADGTPASGSSGGNTPGISGSGVVVFDSADTNLIPVDVNNVSDVFVAQNPFVGSPVAVSLSMSPSSGQGGGTVLGSITLSGPAPAAGAAVALSSNNSVAQPPALVLVPAGATSATFTFTTSQVPAETVVTLIASYQGRSAVAVLTVSPGPVLEISPSSWNFGDQVVGGGSVEQVLTLTNSGTADLNIISIGLVKGTAFSGGAGSCTTVLAAGASCLFPVFFNPTAAGPASDTLQIVAGQLAVPHPVLLSGNGTVPAIGVPSTLAFGSLPLAGSSTQTAVVTNVGGVPVSITAAAVGGANAADFSITGDTCSGTSIAAGFNCLITVNFTPRAIGGRNATLTLTGNAAGSSQTTALTGAGLSSGLLFVPVPPCRVADTRNATGPFGGPFITGNSTRSFTVPNSACGIPSAQAYSLNLTVVPHGSLGFLTAFPCGQPLPLASSLNAQDGRIKAGAAIVPSGPGGAVCMFASNDTDLVIDINGYFVPANTAGALAFYSVTPCRLVDTRLATGPLAGPSLAGNVERSFPILSGPCGLPAAAQAYSLNYTSVPKGPLGFLTTWPAGTTRPLVSTLNAPTAAITANAAIVPVGTNGDISVFVTNDSDLVIDVDGYFAPPAAGGLSLVPVTPCRVVDTRNPSGSQPFNGQLNVNVTGSACNPPATAQAFVLNATVVPPGPLGFLSLWPQGSPQPLVSTLNAPDGVVTSNMAIVPTANGSVSAFGANPTHLVLDISSYFVP